MNAGDLIYKDGIIKDMQRGELREFLCDAIEAVLGPEELHRDSNGFVADTLFRFLDEATITDEQFATLRHFLENAYSIKDEEIK